MSKVLSQVCCFVIDLTIVSGKCFGFEVAAISFNFMRIPATHNFGEEGVRNAKLLVIGKRHPLRLKSEIWGLLTLTE